MYSEMGAFRSLKVMRYNEKRIEKFIFASLCLYFQTHKTRNETTFQADGSLQQSQNNFN